MNVTSASTKESKLYTSQYVGDAFKYEVFQFMKIATEHIMKLSGVKGVDGVGIDLHPRYVTSRFGKEIAEEHGAEIFEIQHHWAHAAALILEHQVNEPIIAIAIDGTGYGLDGNSWGGEILKADFGSFERLAHLEPIPLIGGDAAALDPRRLAFALALKTGSDWNPFSDREAEVFRKLMPNSFTSTSYGRFLDALSARLGVCTKRTYEGEPAIRLEPYIERGERSLAIDIPITQRNGSQVLETTAIFDVIKESDNLDESAKADIAASATLSLSERMAELAVENAEKNGLDKIGISGGVSYNTHIVKTIEKSYGKQQ